ncbi:MAG: N-acetylmuramoyl-L-alanine amidase [Rickettsiales bacterium]|jgi:N-acetylmuramoyl-L-alanine amidase|nr:N-acetylmuramoyl-L-alanine amidase [Rickettsiales bacterium]
MMMGISYSNNVYDIRLNTNDKTTQRIVIDNSDKIIYNAFLLKEPDRLVIDLQDTDNSKIKAPSFQSNSIIDKIRIGKFSNSDSRIVLDLNAKPSSLKNFYLPPSKEYRAHRIVLDLKFEEKIEQNDIIGKFIESKIIKNEKQTSQITKIDTVQEFSKGKRAMPIIVIDAGHGGKDQGSSGIKGTKEKVLTLIYAKSLKNALDRIGKYKVILTRDNDFYIDLQERVSIARKVKADLFISIHCDAAHNKNARGASIYTLSQFASDTRTAQLALKENRTDILSGANLFGNHQDTISTLVDISRIKAMNDSKKFAGFLEQEFKKRNIRGLGVNMRKFANFAVLTSPSSASILLEIGFVSNIDDERMIRTSSYRDKIINSLSDAINRYFKI